jgi:hypothetical protein
MEKEKFLTIWRYFLIVLVIVIVNLLVLDIWVAGNRNEKLKIKNEKFNEVEVNGEKQDLTFYPSPTVVSVSPVDICGPVCQGKIAEEVSRAIATVSGKEKTEKLVIREEYKGPTIVPIEGKAEVVWIPLVSSANTTNTNWTDVSPSDFYFDQQDYPGAKQVKFVAYLRAVDATGPVYARVYDVTNKRGVDNSEISTSSNSYQRFETGALTIWQGNNLYRLQLKSGIGTQALLSEAKLKVEW